MKKDIDVEINKLQNIKEQIAEIERMRTEHHECIFTTKSRYDNLSDELKLNPDLQFIVVDDDVSDYLELT